MATGGSDLIRQMATGDRQAFGLFYDRHAPVVFPRIVRERADASEVLQEIFWEAWRDAGRYDSARGSPEAWMVTRRRSPTGSSSRSAW
jgi:RNA polymerase sigma-70 factor (ECF subfamily)